MPRLPLLLALIVLLAGCSQSDSTDPTEPADEPQPPDGEPASETEPNQGNVTQPPGPPQEPVNVTANTFHVLAEDHWTLTWPNGTEPVEVPLRIANSVMLWEHTFAANATITGGTIELWYRVTGPVANEGIEPSPFTCTFSFAFHYEHVDDSSTRYSDGCYWAPPGMLTEGDHKATIPLTLYDEHPVDVQTGDQLEWQFNFHVTQGSAEPVFFLLGGTPDATQLQLEGLQEPVPSSQD